MENGQKQITENLQALIKKYIAICRIGLVIPFLIVAVFLISQISPVASEYLLENGLVVNAAQFILYILIEIIMLITIRIYTRVLNKNVREHNFKRLIGPVLSFLMGIAGLILTVVSIASSGFLIMSMVLTSVQLFFCMFFLLLGANIEDQLRSSVNTRPLNRALRALKEQNPKTSTSAANMKVLKPLDREESLSKLRNLFEITERVHLNDVAALLDFSREQLIGFLVENKESIKGVKIVGNEIVVQEGNVDNFVDALDDVFKSWRQGGKIEKSQ